VGAVCASTVGGNSAMHSADAAQAMESRIESMGLAFKKVAKV
jgi:hypothetical protein